VGNNYSSKHFPWPIRIQDPLTGDEIIFAPHRLNRPREKDGHCPFCKQSNYPILIENKFPSLMSDIPDDVISKGAKGFCGVIIYNQSHVTQLEDLKIDNIITVNNLLFDTLEDYLESFPYAIAFENRGNYFGSSLSHPHGQFWTFSWVPSNQKQYWNFFERSYVSKLKSQLINLKIQEKNYFSIYYYPYPKLPIELIVIPKQFGRLKRDHIKELSEIQVFLRALVRKYYGFNPKNSLMGWHFPPNGNYDNYLFHLTLHIPHETETRTKIFGGIEYLTRTFINAFPPEKLAKILHDLV